MRSGKLHSLGLLATGNCSCTSLLQATSANISTLQGTTKANFNLWMIVLNNKFGRCRFVAGNILVQTCCRRRW